MSMGPRRAPPARQTHSPDHSPTTDCGSREVCAEPRAERDMNVMTQAKNTTDERCERGVTVPCPPVVLGRSGPKDCARGVALQIARRPVKAGAPVAAGG